MNYNSIIQFLEKQYSEVSLQLTTEQDSTIIETLRNKRVKIYEELSAMRRLQYESQFEMNLNDEY